jgi:hypothetical protein
VASPAAHDANARERVVTARLRTMRVMRALILTGLAFTACTDDGPGSPDALPVPDATSFGGGTFDDLPVFRGASTLQPQTETDGVVTASYETETARPETVLRFYEDQLPGRGWEVIEPPEATGAEAWRGDWMRDGRRLEVSAVALPTDSATDVTRTQFSLILHPDLATSATTVP